MFEFLKMLTLVIEIICDIIEFIMKQIMLQMNEYCRIRKLDLLYFREVYIAKNGLRASNSGLYPVLKAVSPIILHPTNEYRIEGIAGTVTFIRKMLKSMRGKGSINMYKPMTKKELQKKEATYNIPEINTSKIIKQIQHNEQYDDNDVKIFRKIIGCWGQSVAQDMLLSINTIVNSDKPNDRIRSEILGRSVAQDMLLSINMIVDSDKPNDRIRSEIGNTILRAMNLHSDMQAMQCLAKCDTQRMADRMTEERVKSSISDMPKRLYNIQKGLPEEVDKVKRYSTLSYTWGRWAKEKYIVYNTMNTSWKLMENTKVTHSRLKRIIQTMSDIGKSEYVWIDQLCINQNDEKEKALEIARQGIIFENSDVSFIWLHETSIKDMEIFLECQTALCSNSVEWAINAYKAVTKIISDSWFSSLWTTQEAAIAPESIVMLSEGEVIVSFIRGKIDDDEMRGETIGMPGGSLLSMNELKFIISNMLMKSKMLIQYMLSSYNKIGISLQDKKCSSLVDILHDIYLILGETDITSVLDIRTGFLGLRCLRWKTATRSKDYIHGIKCALQIGIQTPYENENMLILLKEFLETLYKHTWSKLMSFSGKIKPRDKQSWLPTNGSVFMPNALITHENQQFEVVTPDTKVHFDSKYRMIMENARLLVSDTLYTADKLQCLEEETVNSDNVAFVVLETVKRKNNNDYTVIITMLVEMNDSKTYRRKGLAVFIEKFPNKLGIKNVDIVLD